MNSKEPFNPIFRSLAWTGPEIRYAGLDLDSVVDIVMHFREEQDALDADLPSVELSLSNGRLLNNQSNVTANVVNIGSDFIEFDESISNEFRAGDLVALTSTTNNDGSYPAVCVSDCRKVVRFDACFEPEAFSGAATLNLWGRFIPVLTPAETAELTCPWYFWDASILDAENYNEPFAEGCVVSRVPRTRPPFGDDLLSVDPPGNTTPANTVITDSGDTIVTDSGATVTYG